VGEVDGCHAGEEEGHNLLVVVIHDRSSGPVRSFLCPWCSSWRWCQGSQLDSSWPAAESGAARQSAESVDAPGARDSGSFGPSHRLDGYTQANKASTRVVGRKGSVSGKRKGEGASGASFSPLRRNTEQVTGTVVTSHMCNSWVAPLLLAAVQQSILGATSSTRQGAAASPAPRVAVALGRRLPLLFCPPPPPFFFTTVERRLQDGCHGADGQGSSAPRVAARSSPPLLRLLPSSPSYSFLWWQEIAFGWGNPWAARYRELRLGTRFIGRR
jgi:hypothetical protein